MIINTGSDVQKSVIIVTAPTGSTVTCAKGSVTKAAVEQNGQWQFNRIDNGVWTVTATKGSEKTTTTVNVTQLNVYRITMSYRVIPEFTYTGSYAVVDDNDNPITNLDTWSGNWKIRFLTSGTLRFTNLRGAANGIDIFLVGGGASGNRSHDFNNGGGGGSGYTITHKNIIVTANKSYTITIGAGGIAPDKHGGQTSFDSYKAGGGISRGATETSYGCNFGGSGGSAGGGANTQDAGYTDGNGSSDTAKAYGQRYKSGPNGESGTTREFGSSSGKLYSTGGAKGGHSTVGAGASNSGDGGGGAHSSTGPAKNGGSGIVIMRNKR